MKWFPKRPELIVVEARYFPLKHLLDGCSEALGEGLVCALRCVEKHVHPSITEGAFEDEACLEDVVRVLLAPVLADVADHAFFKVSGFFTIKI